MPIDARLGIIGGNGWLGGAIAQAAVTTDTVAPDRLVLSGRTDRGHAAETPGVRWTRDNRELVESVDIVVLSVRPEQFPGVKIDASGKLVVSVMAGISVKSISEQTGAKEVVRAIPNAAAAIRRSFTPWFATDAVAPGSKEAAQSLFLACGKAVEVPIEAHVDYCAGFTGPGAAFPALLVEAMIAHAVAQGLPRDFAEQAARSVVADASQLFACGQAGTDEIVQTLIEYRGVTAQALQTMLDRGFNEVIAAGLDAATATTTRLASSEK